MTQHIAATRWAIYGVLFLAFSTPVRADVFYVQQGGTLSRVDDGDPASFKADYWLVEYYRRNGTIGVGEPWGVGTGNSAAEVLAQLAKDQEFERKWEQWCSCSWGDDTFLNPRGPIAVVHASEAKKSFLREVLPVAQRVQGLIDGFARVSAMFPRKPFEPFANVGNVSKEYIDNLKEAIRGQMSLQRILTKVATSGFNPDALQAQEARAFECEILEGRELGELPPATNKSPSPNPSFVGVYDTRLQLSPYSEIAGQVTLSNDTILEVEHFVNYDSSPMRSQMKRQDIDMSRTEFDCKGNSNSVILHCYHDERCVTDPTGGRPEWSLPVNLTSKADAERFARAIGVQLDESSCGASAR